MHPASPRTCSAILTALALTASGCAGLGSGGLIGGPQTVGVDIERPELQQFRAASGLTQIERDARLETTSSEREREVTPPIFWTGIAVGTLGTIGLTGFGIAGTVTKNQLNDIYAEGGVTEAERDRVRDRGELWNTLTFTSAALMVVGLAAAAVAYGVDWNRCGPLVRNTKKRRCAELGSSR